MEPKFTSDLPSPEADAAADAARDPLRLQAAAVAAQQVALSEEENKLIQRRSALEKQEEQLAAHLEDKRIKLLHLSEQAQTDRTALANERASFDQHIKRVTGGLSDAQRELLSAQQKAAAERKRLVELNRRIRRRWHRFWLAERQKFDARQETLVSQAHALEELTAHLHEREQSLTERRLRFNALYELGRCRLREAWQRLRQDQYRWKHRRGTERAALMVRARDVEAAEQSLLEAQRLFVREKNAWDTAKALLLSEMAGMEARVNNQREKIFSQQLEIVRLDAEILSRQRERARLTEPAPAQPIEATAEDAILPAPPAPATDTVILLPGTTPQPESAAAPQVRTYLTVQITERAPSQPSYGQATFTESASGTKEVDAKTWTTWKQRFQDLDRLACSLADQRLHLVEHWQRLCLLQTQWDHDRHQAAAELDELVRQMVEQGHELAQRQQTGQQADQVLRQRHEELIQVRQQMIAWRARLRVREKAWEGERLQLLTEVRNREELANQHLNTLVDLRQRWAKRRSEELEKLNQDRHALEALAKEQYDHHVLLADQTTALEAERRILAEKSLALEQYRKEFLARVENPAAERRLERLRRRWITLNATAIRAASREREALKTAVVSLEQRFIELQKRADAVGQMEADLMERQTAWEHQQALAAARQARLEHEFQSAEAQRGLAEQQVARMKEEIEHIARALIDEPDPPTSAALDQAA